jgi:hypothetical protein
VECGYDHTHAPSVFSSWLRHQRCSVGISRNFNFKSLRYEHRGNTLRTIGRFTALPIAYVQHTETYVRSTRTLNNKSPRKRHLSERI